MDHSASATERILIVSDAWKPQVNGVVTTLVNLEKQLRDMGHQVLLITPDQFPKVPCPLYPGIEFAVPIFLARKIRDLITKFQPTAVHIATPELPLGRAARKVCTNSKGPIPYTAAFHTRLAECAKDYLGIPPNITYRYLRYAYRPAAAILVPTMSMILELEGKGFKNLRLWPPGVDLALFRQQPQANPARPLEGLREPIFGYVGRVSKEKNLRAFLSLDLPGSKLVVGNGPELEDLQNEFPDARFVGAKFGEDLVAYYRLITVLVFPGVKDTFGLVMLEALACGTPVAAFPVTGPKDIVIDGETGCLNWDLRQAALDALKISPAACRSYAETLTWRACAEQFVANLVTCK
jgi:glycosyltransferase involved in cell wall biosynthesis